MGGSDPANDLQVGPIGVDNGDLPRIVPGAVLADVGEDDPLAIRRPRRLGGARVRGSEVGQPFQLCAIRMDGVQVRWLIVRREGQVVRVEQDETCVRLQSG